jgi:hypothetical protein
LFELRILLQQCEDLDAINGSIFREHTLMYVTRGLQTTLQALYGVVIFIHSKYCSLFITLLWAVGMVALVTNAWNLYSEYNQFIQFQTLIHDTYIESNRHMARMAECCFEPTREQECGICISPMRVARKLRCGHCFHQFCIIQLLASAKTTCPICRKDIYPIPTSAPVKLTEPDVQSWIRHIFFPLSSSESAPRFGPSFATGFTLPF